jgi:Fic family protein
MTHYNWQQPDWPKFKYTLHELDEKLFLFGRKTAHLAGILNAMPEKEQQKAMISAMLSEALKTSEIEGEYFSREDVLSSIHKNLDIPTHTHVSPSKKAMGIATLMTTLRHTYTLPLTQQMIWEWHKLLMVDHPHIAIGQWRTHTEPMRVISGSIGKTKTHFEAPPSHQIPHDMRQFIDWFNTPEQTLSTSKNAPLHAAIAHLYFESIHPFEDGNGRIGRAIAEKSLAQGVGYPLIISLSEAIQRNKKQYYDQLELAQRSTDITPWLHYFVDLILTAQTRAEEQVTFTLKKTKFFDTHHAQLNDRQKKVISRMLSFGPTGFEGGMNARKYMTMTKTSKATATRDLQQLLELGALRLQGNAGGRSTSYEVGL